MEPMTEEAFEEKLMELVDQAMDAWISADAVISILELRLMAMREELGQ